MRYVDLGIVGSRESQAVYHAVASLYQPGDPITLITVSPDAPYVCVGYHQWASREIDREYCERAGIPVGRRMVGGGAVYLDRDQIFWHLVLPRSGVPVPSLYDRWLSAQVTAYRAMGIPAAHRPVNDIVVGPRKIGGTGAGNIGDATVVVGSLMLDFDTEAMARVLRVPSEKFRDKMVSGLRDYMTTMRRELGERMPDRDTATRLLVEAFAAVAGEPVTPGALTTDEWARTAQYAEQLFDPAFVYREDGFVSPGVKIREGVRLAEGLEKAPGGLVRVIVREREGYFDDVLITGDFFVEPRDGLPAVARELIGVATDPEHYRPALERALRAVVVPGVTADDISRAIEQALGRVRVNGSAG
jgi:lipoate-protein ligase A